MKAILDEGVPEALADRITGHDVSSVKAKGWRSVKNGKLLALIEKAGFDAFISNDKRIEFDQNLSKRPFAVLLLSTNHWKTLEPNIDKIVTALDKAKPGQVSRVDVGKFVPARMRKPSGP